MREHTEEIRKEFKNRLRNMMISRDMNVAETADAVGCAQCQISNWANGKVLPSYEGILLLSKALGVSPNELMGWEK